MAAVAGEGNGEIERSSTMKILLLGATGLVGKNVLAQALAHPAITGVVAPTRRPLAPHPKLINPVSDRLESLLRRNPGSRRRRLCAGNDDRQGWLQRGISRSGLRATPVIRAICTRAWSGDVCPRFGERCLCQLCDVLSKNQRRDRARHRARGIQITHHRSTQPHRRRAG